MRTSKKRQFEQKQNLCCPRCKNEKLIIVEEGVPLCGHKQYVIMCGVCNLPFVIACDPEEEFLVTEDMPAFCLN